MILSDGLALAASTLLLLPYAPWLAKKLRARLRPRGWHRPVDRDTVRAGVRHTQGRGFSMAEHINNHRTCPELVPGQLTALPVPTVVTDAEIMVEPDSERAGALARRRWLAEQMRNTRPEERRWQNVRQRSAVGFERREMAGYDAQTDTVDGVDARVVHLRWARHRSDD